MIALLGRAILEKELNKMEISNLSDIEFKTLVIRMLKELSEDQQHKKDPVRNEEYTIRNNLQGNNSRVDETKNRIMIGNIGKQKTTHQNNKKKKEKKK